MIRPLAVATLAIFLAAAFLPGQDNNLKSGPQPGDNLPGPFESLKVKGEERGRYHCLVCQYALAPVVMVFAREKDVEKDEAFNSLLQKLDEAAEPTEEGALQAGVIFLSPDAQSSVTKPKAELDPDQLARETAAREALLDRLGTKAENLKHVEVAAYPPEGPKGYQLDPKAAVTIVFYRKMRVVDNHAFEAGALNEEAIDKILDNVKENLRPKPGLKKK